MTPISPKDRPKVIALGVLSVVMVGFFLMSVMGAIAKKPQLHPDGQTPPPDALADAAAPGAGPAGAAPGVVPPGGVPAPEPSPLTTGPVVGGPANPFRHVLPDPVELQRMIAAANRPPVKKMPPMPPLSGALPGPGAVGGSVALAPVNPPAPIIRLDGVVTDRDRYVMVTFNDRTDMYHVGSRIASLFTVVGVTESSASFRGPKGIFRLDVGDERDAAAPILKDKPEPKTKPSSSRAGRTNLRPVDVAEYATLPLPAIEGPAAGRGH